MQLTVLTDVIGYDYNSMSSEQSVGTAIGSIITYVLYVIPLWRIFTKAGQPGWLALIPIVNAIYLIKVSGYSGWFILLTWIPIVGWILWLVFSLGLGRNFGKDGVFSVFLLWLLHLIGLYIIAFGSAQYRDSRTALV